MSTKQINLEFNIIFGNSEIHLPPGLPVRIKAEAVFGSAKLPNDNTRKCMVEIRPEISGTYKAFIYCKSLDEGKEILNIVQPIVDETIAKGIPVIVKRGCYEFSVA